MTDKEVKAFYNSKQWKDIRNKTLELDHFECQKCKHVYHRYRKAYLVHHINHLRDYPEYGLKIYLPNGERQLVSLCNSCHEEEHPEERNHFQERKDKYKNDERW